MRMIMSNASPSGRYVVTSPCSILSSGCSFLAISREIGDSVRKQTQGLVRAGLVSPLTEATAA